MTYLPVDVLIDQKTKQRHRIDTLNLLAYVSLLVIVLVTTWFFKRRANKSCLHETGLAIIYGFIMGAGLRYFGLEVTISSIHLEDKLQRTAPADYVIISGHNLGDKNINQTHEYAYEFRGEIQQNAKLGSQISYASVDPEVFFNIILPPIVLNAGLSLKRRHFFRNIGAIFSYAFLGTTISVATVGAILFGSIQALKYLAEQSYLADRFTLANCLYFGAIISPTDPLAVLAIFQELGVDVNLFALVFGESILNDAVSIVLTHSIDHFSLIYGRGSYYSIVRILWDCTFNFLHMFFASCAIGILFGIITAITTKFTKLTESPLLESSLVVLMSYSAFLFAEVLDTSGIVAILMCGITQAHYTINNLSFEARERLKSLFELLTFLCESFLFLAVGVCFWQRGQSWDLSFIGIAFVAITIARALSVYPLTLLLNLGRRKKIPMNYQHLIAWGGAARGVISYSLAARNTIGDARRIMLSTTSVIVIVTVITVGGLIEPLLRWLKIPFGVHAKQQQQQQQQQQGKQIIHNNAISYEEEHQGDDDEALYHATNNPAWLVRPKKLCWPSGSSMCHRSHYHECNNNSNNDSLVIVADSLATPSVCCATAKGAARRSHFNTRHYLQQRHRHPSSLDNTPVLEIEAAPAVLVGALNSKHQQQQAFNGKRCCACGDSMIDSRTASYASAAATTNQDAGPHLMAQPAMSVHSPASVGQLEQQLEPGSHESQQTNEQYAAIITTSSENAPINTSSTLALVNEPTTTTSNLALVRSPPCSTAAIMSATAGGTQIQLNESNFEARPYENASLVRRWRNIDNYFIKPLLTNSQPTLMETMPAYLRPLARLLTSDEQLMRLQS